MAGLRPAHVPQEEGVVGELGAGSRGEQDR